MPAAKKGTKKVFSADERAAIAERAREAKAAEANANSELEMHAKIAEMQPEDRAIAERLNAIIKASVPSLAPTTWYGMPAYARAGKIVCFFQPAKKFKTRYATLGFNDPAKLDDGSMWPVAYALTKLTSADEAKIRALVKRAAG